MNTAELFQLWPLLEKALKATPNEVCRLFHGRGRCFSGLDQLTVDWLQGQLAVHLFKPVEDDFMTALKEGLIRLSHRNIWKEKQGTAILLQHRYQEYTPYELICGKANFNPVVQENGLKYQLELGKNQNFGLFPDMRIGRDWVRSHAKDKKVLNLFAYTCGFSVAAIEGGAKEVINIDMAKAMLNRGRENHRLNNHNLKQVSFLGHNILKSWGKIKRLGPYDLVIIDPPTFQKGSFRLTNDYPKIIRRLSELLKSEGHVLACVNSPAITPEFLTDLMDREAPDLQFQYRLENPPEFKDKDKNASLKSMVFKQLKSIQK